MQKVKFVSFSFIKGGAAIAANKFTQLLTNTDTQFECELISQDKSDRLFFLKRLTSFFLSKLQISNNPIKHSLNLFSYFPVIKSFATNNDSIHHLHWFNNDTLSIFDLDKIPRGTIITLHDEWLYCGAEHVYNVLDDNQDFKTGYHFLNKGVYGLHWNFIIWKIKIKKISKLDNVIFTVPSNWMLERAKSSVILRNLDVRYLPNPINTEIFKPTNNEDINKLRSNYSIDKNAFVFCFGSFKGKKNHLKGAHLLNKALKILRLRLSRSQAKNIVLLDFGGDFDKNISYGFRSISVGHISDSFQLGRLYSAVDCVVVPSMVESFGQVAAESLACATPVICFDTSGLRDIVHDRKSGLIATAFEPESLAVQMLSILDMSSECLGAMGAAGRDYVESQFSYPVVSKKYIEIIKDADSIKQKYMS